MSNECALTRHSYKVLRRGYFKLDKSNTKTSGLMEYDQRTTYASLFCEKCGKTIEVVESGKEHAEKIT